MANENMRLSRDGAALVKAFESCLRRTPDGHFKAYLCPAGKLTIGWGHTNDHGRPFDANSIWTQAECDAAFAEDMAGFERIVRRLVKVPLNQHQFDALVSFAYNCGGGNLEKSTLLKKVNRGDFAGAAGEFPKWNKGGGRVLAGLVRRRASEALLFQGIPDRDYDGRPDRTPLRLVDTPDTEAAIEDAMPQSVDPPTPAKTMAQSKIGNAQVGTGLAVGTPTLAAVTRAATETGTPDAADPGTVSSLLDQAGNAADVAGRVANAIPEPSTLKMVLGFATDPIVLVALGLVALGFVAFTYWERRRKLQEEGV